MECPWFYVLLLKQKQNLNLASSLPKRCDCAPGYFDTKTKALIWNVGLYMFLKKIFFLIIYAVIKDRP